jgi:sugar lactone lactonase YvrE
MKYGWFRVRIIATCFSLAFVTACGGGQNGVSPSTLGGGANATRANSARVVITIPHEASATSSAIRKSAYVSPSTQSIGVAVDGGTPIYTNLNSTSPACSDAGPLTPLTCTVPITASTGPHTVALLTYDQAQATPPAATPAGNALSSNTVATTIVAGQNNVVAVTLNGVPTTVVLATAPAETTANGGNNGLTLAGPMPKTMLVEALDADGNVIVGPGAPALAISDPGSMVSAAAIPVVGNPTQASNMFTLTPIALGSTTLAVSAVQAGSSGTPATTSASVPTTVAAILAVSNFSNNSVTEYAPWSVTPALTITSGITVPKPIAVDANGTLYVGNSTANTVTEYADGGPTVTRTISGSVQDPISFAFDTSGLMYVANENGTHGISVYAPGNTTLALSITANISNPDALAIDQVGTLYVANESDNTVTAYAGGGTTVTRTITTGINMPTALAVDASGTLYVANALANDVTAYANGGTTLTRTISGGVNEPVALAIDATGTLYVLNTINQTATAYAGGGTTLTRTLSPGGAPSNLTNLIVDTNGTLYVANTAGNTVAVYAGGTTLTRTISSGLSGPIGLALIGP